MARGKINGVLKVNKEGVMQGDRAVSHGPETDWKAVRGLSDVVGAVKFGGDLWPVTSGRP